MKKKTKLSGWIVIDGYCATRVIEGTDPSVVANRVAFIEKSPRVRLRKARKNEKDKACAEGYIWDYDSGSSDYGWDKESRAWCDKKLKELGYSLAKTKEPNYEMKFNGQWIHTGEHYSCQHIFYAMRRINDGVYTFKNLETGEVRKEDERNQLKA